MRSPTPTFNQATIWATALLTGVLFGSAAAFASEEISQAEGLDCVACHTEPASEVLTDRGKFYELMGSFEGFERIAATFEECTACHVSHPGSRELTVRGEMFAFVVSDMEGLLKWVKSEHPGWPEKPTGEAEAAEPDQSGAAEPDQSGD